MRRLVLIVLLLSCAQPPAQTALSARRGAPIVPVVEGVVPAAGMSEAFMLPGADAGRWPTEVVAARVGSVRRDARILTNTSSARFVVPPGTQELTLFLSEPARVGEADAACKVQAKVEWQARGGGAETSAFFELTPSEVPKDWIAIRLKAPRQDHSTHLVVHTETCSSGTVGLALSAAVPFSNAPAVTSPNIVLLVLDTLRYDRLDCGRVSATLAPNLHAFICGHGVVFDNAYATSSWTYPSIASMFTGAMPRDHHAGRRAALTPMGTTLAEALSDAGYDTLAIVPNPKASNGLSRGFASFREVYGRDAMIYTEARRAENMVNEMLTALAATRGPYLLYGLLVDTHEPVDAVKKTGRTLPECMGVEPVPFAWQQLASAADSATPMGQARIACRRALYDEALRYLDRELGRLFAALSSRADFENTVIVVVADHGEELWDHLDMERAEPLGLKRMGVDHGHTLYQELVHIPLMVRPPGGAFVARRENALVSGADVFATILALGGVAAPSRTTSLNLLAPSFQGRRYALSETTLYGPERVAVTTARVRMIQTGAKRQVFDRERDPLEQAPLPGDDERYSDTRYEAILGVPPPLRAPSEPAKKAAQEPVDKAALRALGYTDQ